MCSTLEIATETIMGSSLRLALQTSILRRLLRDIGESVQAARSVALCGRHLPQHDQHIGSDAAAG